ncbi:MAG TPA: hypothetical protein VD995_16900 [Azospirillum sp.]|nr:hypothetical protein [Azospirillum sp.]
MSDGTGGPDAAAMTATMTAVDTLLRAVETLPVSAASPWDIDLLHKALLIARATELPEDLERADLAYKTLSRDSRARLAEHAATLAKRHTAFHLRTPVAGKRPSGGVAGFFAALTGRPATGSGQTAKDRLLRELAGRPSTGR